MVDAAEGALQKAHNELVLSFLSVRRAIGALGFFLPTALFLYGLFGTAGFLPSISAAHYSPMREIFVGTLIAQAVFLWSYEGYREPARLITDKLVARVASVAVALVALAPASPADKVEPAQMANAQRAIRASDGTLLQNILGEQLASALHFAAAGTFFAALAVYCLVLFVRGDAETREKQAEHRIYRLCGRVIIVSIGLAGVLNLTGAAQALPALHPVFWLETVASFAFATSWAVKGDTLRPMVRMMV